MRLAPRSKTSHRDRHASLKKKKRQSCQPSLDPTLSSRLQHGHALPSLPHHIHHIEERNTVAFSTWDRQGAGVETWDRTRAGQDREGVGDEEGGVVTTSRVARP